MTPRTSSSSFNNRTEPSSVSRRKIELTSSASLSMMTSLRSCARYPNGCTPPIHIPFRFEAAILSRMRSPIDLTLELRKGQQDIQGQAPHRGRRVELLRDRHERGTRRVEDLDDLGEIGERAGQPVDFVDDDRVDPPRGDIGKQPLQRGPIQRGAGEPAIVISRAQAHPALVPLTVNESLAGLTLRQQGIEFLLETLLGGFAGIDGTANPCAPRYAAAGRPRHRSAAAPTEAPARLVRPKNRGPDQCAPVIRSAIMVSER